MFREKLVTTLLWSAIPIAGAMLIDYIITIVVLQARQSYTPLATLFIAIIVTLPTTYVLVSGRLNLRKARDDVAVARDEAIKANLSKTLFFANMSHELRTPLNAILGFSELLASDIFAQKRVEYARLIHSSGAHLLDLVNDLLDLSRIEAGKLELHNEVLSLKELVEESAKVVESRARASQIRIVRTVEAGIPDVVGDRRALKQILLNLLTNSIKFSKAGGAVEIFASLDSSGDLAFGVRDDGIGILDEQQSLVFERFGQARHDTISAQEGSGLGLPIVKGLAEAHGGRVQLQSKFGQGTCITVWLPRERVKTQPLASSEMGRGIMVVRR
jgi:two-component system, cell cycle sensor histidine kinase PleC